MATATINDAPDPLAAVRDALSRLAEGLNDLTRPECATRDARNRVDADLRLAYATANDLADYVSGLVDAVDEAKATADAAEMWPHACKALGSALRTRRNLRAWPRDVRRRLEDTIALMAKVVRTMAVVWVDSVGEVPDDIAREVWTIRIPPLAYLRAMANSLWSAVRYPLKSTTIDLETGRVLYRE